MSKKKWLVALSSGERAELQGFVQRTGKARPRVRARIVLLAADGLTDEEIAAEVRADRSTVERTRRRFAQGGLAAALTERPRPGGRPALDEQGRQRLAERVGSSPPAGRQWWTMRLLANELMAQQVEVAISDETIRRALHRMGLLAAPERASRLPKPRAQVAAGRPT